MFNEKVGDEMAPMDRVVSIGTLYFPELEKEIDTLAEAARAFEQWCIDRGQDRINTGGTFVPLTPDKLDSYGQVYRGLRGALVALRNAAGSIMRSL